MALQAGIVGLPNVGKSTLFNAVSNSAKAQASNYRFCTIEPNVGLVNVPDTRLDKLAELVQPQRIVPTQIEIVDIAGLVRGASKGEGLGNKFLANIREVDAIIHVIRCFEDENILREEGPINPVSDKEIIETELQLKDLESVEKKIQRTEKLAKTDVKAKAELEILLRCKAHLDSGKNIISLGLIKEEKYAIADLFLLTSEYESFGLAALEAMAAEVPVISTNAGGLPEININGYSGFMSNVGNVDEMSKNALAILKDETTLLKFKANALAQAKKFDIENIVPQYEALYKRMI